MQGSNRTVPTDLDHYEDELENSSDLSDTELLRDARRRAGIEPTQPPPERTPPKPDLKAPKPYKSFDDKDLRYRTRGQHADGARSADANSDAAERSFHGIESRSLLDLHISTGGAYRVGKESTDPNQPEVCRECEAPLALLRDDQGFVIRGKKGQTQYCSDRCRKDRKNLKARNRRARASGKRVLSSYSLPFGVPSMQRSTGPQERSAAGEVLPWTVPCWAADPWLKFVVEGSVPFELDTYRTLTYADPVGDLAAANVDNRISITDHEPEASLGIPVGKRMTDQKRYFHNVFDEIFNGMDYYRQMVLAGKPA